MGRPGVGAHQLCHQLAFVTRAAGGSRTRTNTSAASSRYSCSVATGRRRSGATRAPRVFGGRWEVVKRLGQGGQGTAYLVRNLTTDSQAQWVLKELRDDKRESCQRRQKRLLRFEREIAALDRLKQSPHIPPVVDFHVGPEASYLVTPYVGKNLEKLRNVVEPQAVLQRFRGIVDAVKYANDREVVHRDIKPNNVTVNDDGTPYLVDFGICAYDESEVGLTSTMEGFGNRYFAAPECDAGSVDDARKPSDIYSLGRLLYWMVSGRGKMGREEFDEDKFTFTDKIARQYMSVLIKHTVREAPAHAGQRVSFLNASIGHWTS